MQFGRIVLNLGQQFRCHSKISIFNFGGHFVQWSGTIQAIFEEVIMGNICVKPIFFKFESVV